MPVRSHDQLDDLFTKSFGGYRAFVTSFEHMIYVHLKGSVRDSI